MVRGRKPYFRNPLTISLVVEQEDHERIRSLRLKESDVYLRGMNEILKERSSELTVEFQESLIQDCRRKMQTIQEEIAWRERVLMDTQIKETRNQRIGKKIIETRLDERGQPYQVVMIQ